MSSTTLYGTAVEIPYYWALAPNYDVTFAPMITTRQGPLVQGEFRHRLMNGAYSIRASGIKQWDKEYFNGPSAPGYRDYRGSVESSGQFAINSKWVWGWDAVALSDKTYLQDYKPRLSAYTSTDPFANVGSEGISQLYLVGKGNRSYFDGRSIYYLGFSSADVQSQIPIIHPVIDYTYTFDHPVMGGELSYNLNFISLSRQQADFRRDYHDRDRQSQYVLHAERGPGPGNGPIACCAVSPANITGSRPRPRGGAPSPIHTGKCSRPSLRSAPMPPP